MQPQRIVTPAVGLLLAFLTGGPAFALSAAEFYARAQNSVILIHTLCFTKDARNIEEYGSGFILDEFGHVATARHVVPDPAKCEALSIEGAAGENALQNPRWKLTHTASHDKADVAVLQIENFPAVKQRWGLVGLDVSLAETLRPGEEIYVLGYPEGEALTISRGMITGRATGMWRTDAPLNPGTSGGAVLTDGVSLSGSSPLAVATVKGAVRYTSAGIPTEGWGYITPIEATRQILPTPPPPALPQAAAPAQIRLRERISMPQVSDKSVTPESIRYKLDVLAEHGYQIRIVELAPAVTDVRIVSYRLLANTAERATMECEVSGDPATLERLRSGDWANPNARLPIVATTTQTLRQ